MDFIKIHFGKGMQDINDQVEQMIDEMLHLSRACIPRSSTCWVPPTDIYETPAEVIVLMEMAGLKKEEIEVSLDQNVLRVSGRRLNPIQDPHRKVHQMGVYFGPFERNIRLRGPVDADSSSATYQEGFLMIRVQRAASVRSEIRVEERPK
jgi:HSP20 family protein